MGKQNARPTGVCTFVCPTQSVLAIRGRGEVYFISKGQNHTGNLSKFCKCKLSIRIDCHTHACAVFFFTMKLSKMSEMSSSWGSKSYILHLAPVYMILVLQCK